MTRITQLWYTTIMNTRSQNQSWILSVALWLSALVVYAADGGWTTMRGITCRIQRAEVYGVPVRDITTFDQRLMSLSGPNLWLSSYGWNIPNYPAQGHWESDIELHCADHNYSMWVWTAYAAPDVRYVFVFNSMKSNCDAHGKHCGNHDFVYDGKLPMTFSVSAAALAAVLK